MKKHAAATFTRYNTFESGGIAHSTNPTMTTMLDSCQLVNSTCRRQEAIKAFTTEIESLEVKEEARGSFWEIDLLQLEARKLL